MRQFGHLLLPVVGGYYFLTRWHCRRFVILRSDGYHVFLESSCYGVVLFLAAYALSWLLKFKFDCQVPLDHVLVLSALLGLVAHPFNWVCDENNAWKKAARGHGDAVELMLFDAAEKEILVELSIKSRKSYIGYVTSSAPSASRDPDVSIIPLLSGYRRKDNCELVIQINYAGALKKRKNEKSEAEFSPYEVVVPKAELYSVRLFDRKVYELFLDGQLKLKKETG